MSKSATSNNKSRTDLRHLLQFKRRKIRLWYNISMFVPET